MAAAKAAVTLDVYADAYPPFLNIHKNSLRGPMVEAFAKLMAQRGITPRFIAQPTKRVMLTIATTPNSCGLAVNFSPGDAETITYVARIAPVTIAVYARKDWNHVIKSVADLKSHSIGAIDIAEIRDLLDLAGIRYEPLAKTSSGMRMLAAARFDLLISDLNPEYLTGKDQQAHDIHNVLTLARLDRWLACNPKIDSTTLSTLRRTLKTGLFNESTQIIWQQHGLVAYWREAMQEWNDVAPPVSGK
ncbi:hypothetical protein [Chitinivorax sp. B]|uniref:hypothetical protein n=1 Tax=Chitinivorax sp. B TaxID=2502235 RepID=UPI0010F9C8B1|nr:hypothetical protein [Chitinivorax sp. B]